MSQTDYFCNKTIQEDLRGKAVRGGVVIGITQVIQMAMTMGVLVVLSRILTRDDFGLMAMVALLTGFANMFVDAGLSIATIQRKDINHQQVSNLFWIACGIGLLVACFVALISPLVAWFFGEPRLVYITLAISITFAISGLSIQHQALLRRAMHFNHLSAIQLLSGTAGQIVAMVLAWQTRSYWALVAMPIVTAIVRVVLLWCACTWRPGRLKKGVGSREMVVFGGNLTGFNVVNYFARNADKLLIGWMWGTSILGDYDRAYKLMLGPLTQVMGPLNAVVHPMMCRLQGDPSRYRSSYLNLMETLLCLTVPISMLCIVMSDWIVLVMLGEGWSDVAPILFWLAISGIFQPLYSSVGWLYISQNRSSDMVRWGFFNSGIIMLSFLVGLKWGAIGVASSYTICFILVVLPVAFWCVGRHGPVSAWDIWGVALRPVVLALAMAGPIVAVRLAWPDLSAFKGIACSIPFVVFAYAGLLFTFRSHLKRLASVFGFRSAKNVATE